MYTRYQDREVNEVLDIASLLDPRFKMLAHLSDRYFRLCKRDWKQAMHAKSRCTFICEPSAVYVGLISAFVKVLDLTLAEEIE